MRGTYTTRWQPGNKRTKYGAKKTVTGGRKYDSKAEASYSQQLELRRLAGEIIEIIPQYQVGIYIGGSLWRKWSIDFKVVLKDGTVELHEVKGMEVREYQLKRDAFLKIQASDCDCNYITEYKNGNRIDKTVELIVIK